MFVCLKRALLLRSMQVSDRNVPEGSGAPHPLKSKQSARRAKSRAAAAGAAAAAAAVPGDARSQQGLNLTEIGTLGSGDGSVQQQVRMCCFSLHCSDFLCLRAS